MTTLHSGMKGNLTARKFGMIIFIALSIPTFFGVLFFLLWQTYV